MGDPPVVSSAASGAIAQRSPLAARRGWAEVQPAAVVAALVVLWALAPVLAIVAQVRLEGGVATGIDGVLAGADQFQYLAWIREAAEGLLVSNQFDLAPSDAVYLNPAYGLGALLVVAGLPVELAYHAVKLGAVALLLAGTVAYVRRLLGESGAGIVALVLALGFLSPLVPLIDWLGITQDLDVFQAIRVGAEGSVPWLLWGYPLALAAAGLMPLYLLAAERVVDPTGRAPGRGRGWYAGWAAVAGLLCSWVHPWQGLILVLVTAGVAVWARLDRRYWLLALPAAAACVPLLYFRVLAATDPVWQRVAQEDASPGAPLWAFAVALGPLALLAALDAFRPARDLQERALRLWPLVALVLAAGVAARAPLHALGGVALPLAILAVRAVGRRPPSPRIVVALVALAVVPGCVYAAEFFRTSVKSGLAPYRLKAGEHAALRYVEDSPRAGGVLARAYLSAAVPARTGRRTWVGHFAWTPDFLQRRRSADRLVAGVLAPAQARSLVRGTGAAFLVADCGVPRADLATALGGLVAGERRFGCATVYELRQR